jgi:5-methylcytosine-specific restriction endonuclease McrA
MIDQGAGFIRCREAFGIAHATWIKALQRGDIRVDPLGKPYADARRRYDWAVIQAYHDEGHSVRACRKRFGFSMQTWQKARAAGRIRARGRKPLLTIEQLGRNVSNRGGIKKRLIASGVLKNECAICGISEWQGSPLSLQIDHINGKKLDYRIQNLRILCPNCHSQTETFAGRNLVAQRRGPGSSSGRMLVSDTSHWSSNL